MSRRIPLFRRPSFLADREMVEQVGLLVQRPRKHWRDRHGGGPSLPYLRVFTDDELASSGHDTIPEDIIKLDGIDSEYLNPDGILVRPVEVDGFFIGHLPRACRIRYNYPTPSILAADFQVPTNTEMWYETIYYITGLANSASYFERLSNDVGYGTGTETYAFMDQFNRTLYSGQRVNGSATSTSQLATGFSSIAAGQYWVVQAKIDPVGETLKMRFFRREQFMWGTNTSWKTWDFTRVDWPSSPLLRWIISGFWPYSAASGSYYLIRWWVALPEHGWPSSEDAVYTSFDEQTIDSTPDNITVPAGSGSWTVKAIPNDSNSYKPTGFTYAIRSPTTSPTQFYFPLNRATTGTLRVELLAYVSYGGQAAAYLTAGFMTNAAWYPGRRIGVQFGRNQVGSYEWISQARGVYNVTEDAGVTAFDSKSWSSTSPYRPDWNRWMLYTFEFDPEYSHASYGEYGRFQVGVRRKEDGNRYPTVIERMYPPSAWPVPALTHFFLDFESVDTESAYIYVAQISVTGDGYDYPLGVKQ